MAGPTIDFMRAILITEFMWRCTLPPCITDRRFTDGRTIRGQRRSSIRWPRGAGREVIAIVSIPGRSEEHTSELQSHVNLVCRLLLEKKKRIFLSPSQLKIKKIKVTPAN